MLSISLAKKYDLLKILNSEFKTKFSLLLLGMHVYKIGSFGHMLFLPPSPIRIPLPQSPPLVSVQYNEREKVDQQKKIQ